MFTGPASLGTSLLWARTLTGSTCVNRSTTLECGTVLISGYAPMGQVPAFGTTVLGVDLSVNLFACGLTFVFRLVQVFTTSSGPQIQDACGSLENSVISFPGS